MNFGSTPAQRFALILALLLSLGLRAVLTHFNTEANDDHVEPILYWMEQGVYPNSQDCWECFQPPLPYLCVKSVAEVLDLHGREAVFSVFKWINFALASIVLMALLYAARSLPLPFWMQWMSFLFWGLNPKLLGIGAQATNDLFVICLGTLFVVQAIRYLQRPGLLPFLMLLFLMVLALLSKASGIIWAVCLLGLLIYGLIRQHIRWGSFAIRLATIFFGLILAAQYGHYYQKYEQFGTPFKINIDQPNRANFYQPDSLYWGRAGVISFTQSFLSFRLGSLIKEPYNVNSGPDYPQHRTSYFSQLYGQYSHILFERHPPSWQSPNNYMLNLARANYLLQLPLLLLFLVGLILGLRPLAALRLDAYALASVLVILFLLIGIRFSFLYRDFSTMKLLYLFPAVLAMQLCFNRGLMAVSQKIQFVAFWLMGGSCLLYLANILYLIRVLS